MRVLLATMMILGCGEPSAPAVGPDAGDVDAGPCTKPRVFINMLLPAGETYEPGTDDSRSNRSSLLEAPATFTPMTGDTAAVVTATRALLEPYGIVVTDVDPGDTPHIEIIVVGDPWPFDSGFAALAPSFCSLNGNAIAMVNEFEGRTPADLAVSVAFVLGVVNGLEYSDEGSNCMALTIGGSTCAFGDASPVTQPPRCPGGGTSQDQIRILTQTLGCE